MNSLNGKRILLLYAKFFNYDNIVKHKLEELGATVDLFDARANLSGWEKALKKVYRGLYTLKQRRFHKEIQEKQKDINYDYVFSNAYLDQTVVKGYRNMFPQAKLILFLDDSVANMKGVENTFLLYDSVSTFDRHDATKFNIGFCPLFYSDNYDNEKFTNEYDYDLCFIGTLHSDRLKVISKIEKYCSANNLIFYNYCYLPSKFIYYYYLITKKEFRKKKKQFFKFKQMSSTEIAEIISKSRCVLDIEHPKQTGLTMRTIETLGSRKKIITTNKDIQNYNIYNENNVCVIDRNNPIFAIPFLYSEFNNLPSTILYDYSIEGWIAKLFN